MRKGNSRSTRASRLLNEEVTEEDIAQVVAAWTGIPVSRMLEGEREKLVKMEERLQQRVIGQEEAITRRGQCRAPLAQRFAGPEPAHRLVYFSRPDRRGQNRTGPRAGGIFV